MRRRVARLRPAAFVFDVTALTVTLSAAVLAGDTIIVESKISGDRNAEYAASVRVSSSDLNEDFDEVYDGVKDLRRDLAKTDAMAFISKTSIDGWFYDVNNRYEGRVIVVDGRLSQLDADVAASIDLVTAVSYLPQSLTAGQQSQARANLGVSDISGLEFITSGDGASMNAAAQAAWEARTPIYTSEAVSVTVDFNALAIAAGTDTQAARGALFAEYLLWFKKSGGVSPMLKVAGGWHHMGAAPHILEAEPRRFMIEPADGPPWDYEVTAISAAVSATAGFYDVTATLDTPLDASVIIGWHMGFQNMQGNNNADWFSGAIIIDAIDAADRRIGHGPDAV